MRSRWIVLTLALLLWGGFVAAQDRDKAVRDDESGAKQREPVARDDSSPTRQRQPVPTETDTDAEAGDATAADGTRQNRTADRVIRASRLPRATTDAREAGVEEEKIEEVIRDAREGGLPAGETEEILVIETEEVRSGGDPENFGATVHQLKASGLRGRELAEAIHAEQIARGMKKPKHKDHPGRGHGKDKGRGHDDDDDDDDRDEGKRDGKGKGKGGKKTRGNS